MSFDPKTPSIKDLLGGGPLASLLSRARDTQSHEAKLRSLLPDYGSAPWSLARVDEQTLVIVTPSAAWAARMRFAQAQWLSAAAEVLGGGKPAEFQVLVRPDK